MIAIAAIVAIAAVALLTVFRCDPQHSKWLPKCLFHEVTGLFCPGCGNTRALHALLHGHILMSLRYNLLLIPAILTVLLLVMRPRLALKPSIAWSIAVVVIAFAILRNLPWMPFLLLAPPA